MDAIIDRYSENKTKIYFANQVLWHQTKIKSHDYNSMITNKNQKSMITKAYFEHGDDGCCQIIAES